MRNRVIMMGLDIKRKNGSGYSLANAFKFRKFHDATLYVVRWNGVQLDASTVTSIVRSRTGWK